MKILGNRVLVSKIEEPKKEGEFQTVEVQDAFVYKGKIEALGDLVGEGRSDLFQGQTILFAKYSPDTQEIEHEGRKLKFVLVTDILAVL